MKTQDCQHCRAKQLSVFQDCPAEIMDKVFVNKEFIQFEKNEVILRQNGTFKGVFCINDGTVKITTFGSRNREFILWFARGGEILGLDSFMNNRDHIFAATAITPVNACFIPAGDFKKLVEKFPVISKKLIKLLCREINSIEERITSISQKSVREQFAEVLISIATKNRRSSEAGTPINYSIRDLANTIGTTNNYLYKIISDFNDKNVVAIHNKKIVIKNFDKLSLIAIGEDSPT